MRIASRFAIGIHILALMEVYPEVEATSDLMAASIGVNAVIVRNVTGMLRRAGLVRTRQGVAGAQLAKPLHEITLLEVYRAVHAVEEADLFALHEKPHPACLVGNNIQKTLEGVFTEAQQAMETRLAQTSMAQVVTQLRVVAAQRAA
ncbi:Rrf2 family transcriptional regulator [Armatimonas rosea]|uniref:DNA-binding IscR family transcriptional regulator n=1 Tax=Armatimonas rosea TaxID=685828 RepID=A0A7W9W7C7_ARMRO|nr:Rrf2 family transcriptional regulator [Armatimonas rosea]MBB6051091.1 DNA-binding IscR family transcriptional regulator [Armatimonas rosea]